MQNIEELKKIAILIDADNAQRAKLKFILDEVSVYGYVIEKRAYGDWANYTLKYWKDELNRLAIQPIQQFAYTTGKNATDVAMVIDAMDLLYTNRFDAFVLVSSDSDFTRLASRLRTSGVYVFGVGEAKTPQSFRSACNEFIYTEYLGIPTVGPEDVPSATTVSEDNSPVSIEKLDMEDVIDLLNLACDKYQDDDGWVNVSSAGTFIKRTKPDFDVRIFGYYKLPDLIKGLPEKYETKKYKGKGTVNVIAYRKILSMIKA